MISKSVEGESTFQIFIKRTGDGESLVNKLGTKITLELDCRPLQIFPDTPPLW